MKKMTLFHIFAGILLASGLYGSELVCTHNRISSVNKSLLIQNKGTVILQGKGLYMSGSLNAGTKAGYFSFASQKTKSTFSKPEQTFFLHKGTFPEHPDGRSMPVTQSVATTPMGTVELTLKWEPSDVKNLNDFFYIFTFPMKHLKDRYIIANGKKVPVKDITKYGFFNEKRKTPAALSFCDWSANNSFSIQSEAPIRVLIQSIKGKSVMVRFYPDVKSRQMKLIFHLQ